MRTQSKKLEHVLGCSVLVRVEVFRGLGRMRADREDLPVLAREIRNRLGLEQEGSAVWFAGIKALDKLSYY